MFLPYFITPIKSEIEQQENTTNVVITYSNRMALLNQDMNLSHAVSHCGGRVSRHKGGSALVKQRGHGGFPQERLLKGFPDL